MNTLALISQLLLGGFAAVTVIKQGLCRPRSVSASVSVSLFPFISLSAPLSTVSVPLFSPPPGFLQQHLRRSRLLDERVQGRAVRLRFF